MLIETLSQSFQKACSTDATDTSFPSRIPTGTEPTGSGVIDCGTRGALVQNAVLLVPYCTSGDNDTFSIRLIGWRVLGNVAATLLWVPVVLAELACTASATTGVAGKLIVAAERFVDTLTIISGNDDVSIDIVSPTADEIAHAVCDVKGFQKLETTYDATAAGTSAMNCLYAFL